MTAEQARALAKLLKRLHLARGTPEADRAASAWEDALRLAAPRGFRTRLDLPEFLHRFDDHLSPGSRVRSSLEGCTHAWLVAATIGPALETRAAELFAAGEPFAGYVLDSFGTWLADQTLRQQIAAVRARPGRFTPRRMPGCHGFALAAQAVFVELAGERLDIALTPAFLLMPQKSVTAVIGHFDPTSTPSP